MEKGKISQVAGFEGEGIIVDLQGMSVGFNNSSLVGKNRNSLQIGDDVWFERTGGGLQPKAINVRRC